MRIGTWNLERAVGGKNNELRLARLVSMNADVWILTETHDGMDLGPTHQPVHSNPRPDARAGERWVSIWSRFPVLDLPRVVDPVRTVAARLATPLGKVLVYGTVLPWQSDRGPGGSARFWSEHHRVLPEQGQEWLALSNRYSDSRVCIAGDFNMNLGGQHYYGTRKGRDLLRRALDAAGLAVVTETEQVPAGKLAYPPIDHICRSRSMAARSRVVDAWNGVDRDGIRLSDHSGLVVEVV